MRSKHHSENNNKTQRDAVANLHFHSILLVYKYYVQQIGHRHGN